MMKRFSQLDNHYVTTCIDIISAERFHNILTIDKEIFLKKVYMQDELLLAEHVNEFSFLLTRFSAKEAIMKCLLPLENSRIQFSEIEILRDINDAPLIILHGNAQKRADELHIKEIALSLSYEEDCAIAYAIAFKECV